MVTQIQCVKFQTKQRSKLPCFIPLLYVWKILKTGQNSLSVCCIYSPKMALNIFLLPVYASCLSHQRGGVYVSSPGLALINGEQPKCCSGTSEPKPEGDWQLPLATFWGLSYNVIRHPSHMERPHEASLSCSS